MTHEKLEEFRTALKAHDWYFDYSDDHRVWRRGFDAAAQLQAMREELWQEGLGEQAEALWREICPYNKEVH